MATLLVREILASVFVFTGTLHIIMLKWASRTYAKGVDGQHRRFQHPYVQTWIMFLGDTACLCVYKFLFSYYRRKEIGLEEQKQLTKGKRNFSKIVLLPPALLDIGASVLILLGLVFTYSSSIVMLRSSSIIFIVILSRIFLNRRYSLSEYIGMSFVSVGPILIVLSDINIINKKQAECYNAGENATDMEGCAGYTLLGDLLVIGANMLTGTQHIWEDIYVTDQDIPILAAVGWEGVFGLSVVTLLMVPFHFIPMGPPLSNNSRGTVEDIPDALVQMYNRNELIFSMVVFAVSVAVCNCAGLCVTKMISSTSRMVIGSLKTAIVGMCALALRWETFHWLQLIGFLVIICGNVIYNNMTIQETVSFIGHRMHRSHGTVEVVFEEPAPAEPNAEEQTPEEPRPTLEQYLQRRGNSSSIRESVF